MAGYLLDTNILINWFGDDVSNLVLDELIERPDARLCTSAVCVAEFFSGCNKADAASMKEILLSGEVEMLPFEGIQSVESAAFFRKTYGMKLPDAIVAAAALEHHLALLTFDRDFAKKAKKNIQVIDLSKNNY